MIVQIIRLKSALPEACQVLEVSEAEILDLLFQLRG